MMSRTRSSIISRLAAILLIVCLIVSTACVSAGAVDETAAAGAAASSDAGTSGAAATGRDYDTGGDDYNISLYSNSVTTEYEDVLPTYGSVSSYGLTDADKVVVSAAGAVQENGSPAPVLEGHEGYSASAVYSDKTVGDLSWKMEIPKTGLYEIEIDYIADDTDKADIQRQLTIDGESPFKESENILFLRRWEEASAPKLDINGDQLSPKMQQVLMWSKCQVCDVDGMYDGNLRFLLEAGTHTISINYVASAVYIGNIYVNPAKDYKTYEQVKAEYAANAYKEYTGDEDVRVEAEDADYRSSQVLRRQYNSDPANTPYSRGHVVLNTIGGFNWRTGNQRIEYKITVPESGLYKLNFRVFQNHGEGLSVHRQITIDGEVPFAEMASYAFAFDSKWQNVTIEDEEGNPYLFYLEAGEHILGIQVKMGQATKVIKALYEINTDVTNLIRDITKVTGNEPDLNFDYNLEKTYPNLITDMEDIRDRYYEQIDYLKAYCEKTPTLANSLYTAADQLDYLVNKPDQIPAKLDQMTDVQGSVSQWYFDIQDQPMMIDYVRFTAPEKELKLEKSSFWEKLAGTFVNFVTSFYKDYDSILYAVDEETVETDTVLDVWVARSKEMSEVIQRMANEDFVVDSGIGVNINIMPSGSVGAVGSISPLMLAVISGTVPDIALGSDSATPVELAIRGAAYDLTSFPDFDEVVSRFLPETMIPLEYEGGYYALPENMDFKMMFYRKDILSEMEIEIPQTWGDLYNKVLPILDQNGMDFYMASDYATFLFQNGGEYYNEDKTATALDSNIAYQAFLQWTKNYTVYDIPETADIYNHFRIGDIPLCIGGYADYIKIMYAAPELYGKWDIAPIPGTYDENGKLNRMSGGASTTLLIFTDSVEKEGAWEFAKWWMSADVQSMFSTEIEAIMGLEARWNSANIEAFMDLPWDEDHVKVFQIAFNNFKNQPNTLGGYYTARNVSNAWTRVVMNDVNARTSWEKAIDDISNEILRKRIEYGYISADEAK